MPSTALHQLRDAIKNGDSIELDGGFIVLGGAVQLEPSQPTNYHSMRGRGDAYTLDSVYTQWRYRDMAYQDYVQECSRSCVQHVNALDRRDLVAYLSGEINACAGLVAAPASRHEQEGPEPKKRKLDGPRPITVTARRQPREQRSIDAVLMVADWDFTTIREKLGRSLEKAKKTKQIGTTNGPSTSGTGSVGATTKPATFDPRGDRYATNPDRSWREYMGNEFQEFGINPMGSFTSAPKKAQDSKAPAAQNGASKPAPAPKPLPPQQQALPKRLPERRHSEPKRSVPVDPSALRPILIVPGPGTSLVNLSNIKEFFEKGHFVTEEELRKQGVAPDFSGRIKANRTPGGNCSTADYLLVSNVGRLTDAEWERVIGVVCTGKAYQFKHWKWAKGSNAGGGGVDVVSCLHRVQGFYFHYDDIKPDSTAASWAVKLIPISRSKRYQDGYAQRQFFDAIDSFIKRHSKRVRY